MKEFPQNTGEPFSISPPYGKECIKIIASTQPLEFSRSGTRGINDGIANLEAFENGVESEKAIGTRGIEKSFLAYIKTIQFFITSRH